MINLDEYKSIEALWIALYANGDNVTYFDSFGVEYIPKENKKSIINENITTNIFRIQTDDSIMLRYFFIGFIDFLLKRKSFSECTNLL